MRGSAIEFRLRMLIMAVLIFLGFWAPWIDSASRSLSFAERIPVLEWLPLELSRLGLLSFATATPVVIVCGALVAGLGAVLRVWGSAYLGTATVQNRQMLAGAVMADGPYRYVRNPLYIGSWCMIAAIALLMPPTGALFCMVLVAVFLLRLILGEESFLAGQLGEPYLKYKRAVPRLIPRLRSNLPASGSRPRWLRAALTELTAIGVFFTVAVLSWSYDNRLMGRAILISFGASLVSRAVWSGDSTGRQSPAE